MMYSAGVSAPSRISSRLSLLALTTLLSLYPTLSRAIVNWSASQVGEGKGEGGRTYVDDTDWATIDKICFRDAGLQSLRGAEHKVLGGFQMMAWLFAADVVVGVVGSLVRGVVVWRR